MCFVLNSRDKDLEVVETLASAAEIVSWLLRVLLLYSDSTMPSNSTNQIRDYTHGS